MSTIRTSNLGPLTGNTAQVVDAVTPTSGSATFSPLVSFAPVASTSGTFIDFIGIPSWVKRITVLFGSISTNGNSPIMIQLGTSSGFETSSYLGAANNIDTSGVSNGNNFTNGLRIYGATGATLVSSGQAMISLIGNNNWAFFSVVGREDYAGQIMGSGRKALSGTLDRIRITTVGGTDAFDNGNVNVFYE